MPRRLKIQSNAALSANPFPAANKAITTDDIVDSRGADSRQAALAREDPYAFEQLYVAYRDRVYLYMLRRMGNPEEAADLTQQVFLNALRAIGQYRPEKAPFAAWLFAIARNAAHAVGRRKRVIVWDAVAESIAAEDDQLAKNLETEEELTRLRACLARLDRPGQEIILLRFEVGLTVSEIAAMIDKKPEAAKKTLQRTLKKLKELYDDEP